MAPEVSRLPWDLSIWVWCLMWPWGLIVALGITWQLGPGVSEQPRGSHGNPRLLGCPRGLRVASVVCGELQAVTSHPAGPGAVLRCADLLLLFLLLLLLLWEVLPAP